MPAGGPLGIVYCRRLLLHGVHLRLLSVRDRKLAIGLVAALVLIAAASFVVEWAYRRWTGRRIKMAFHRGPPATATVRSTQQQIP